MRLEAVIALFRDLEGTELRAWIRENWVRPHATREDDWVFEEVDVARVRLIYDLRREFEVPEDSVPMVLGLVDQVYELRGRLKCVLEVVETQPQTVRDLVRQALKAERQGH